MTKCKNCGHEISRIDEIKNRKVIRTQYAHEYYDDELKKGYPLFECHIIVSINGQHCLCKNAEPELNSLHSLKAVVPLELI
jgi:DNA primase large subunit